DHEHLFPLPPHGGNHPRPLAPVPDPHGQRRPAPDSLGDATAIGVGEGEAVPLGGTATGVVMAGGCSGVRGRHATSSRSLSVIAARIFRSAAECRSHTRLSRTPRMAAVCFSFE